MNDLTQIIAALRAGNFEAWAETTGGRGMDQLDEVRDEIEFAARKLTAEEILVARSALDADSYDDRDDDYEVNMLNLAVSDAAMNNVEWRDYWADAISCGIRRIGG